TDLINSCRGFPAIALGRQRRHSRKPALSASCGLRKNVTFSRLGRFEGHEGRQYTPVEETANTNFPSLAPSRSSTACHRESSITFFISNCLGCSTPRIILFMAADYGNRGNLEYPHLAVKPIFLGTT